MVINDATGAEQLQGHSVSRGVATIFTTEPSVDLLVLAVGYRPVELTNVSRDTEVVLHRYPVITISLAGGAPQLPPDHDLHVGIRRANAGPRDTRMVFYGRRRTTLSTWTGQGFTRYDVDGAGPAAVTGSGEGAYLVTVQVQDNSVMSTHPLATISGTTPKEIHVDTSVG